MNDNHPPIDWADRLLGFGAGLASALLFAASARGTNLAMALAYFTPLPLLIAAIGFSSIGALGGLIVGAGLLSFVLHPLLGPAFFVSLGLPAFILGALAGNPLRLRGSKPSRKVAATDAAPPAAPYWLSTGALLFIVILLAVGLTWAGVAALIYHYNGFEPAITAITKRFDPVLEDLVGNLRKMAPDVEGDMVKRMVLLAAPAGVAASQVLMLAVNLYFAALTVSLSDRLSRPWPAIPETLALPKIVGLLFAASCATAFAGGWIGVFAGALAAASGLGLAFQGLATIHALTRPLKLRGALLAALYAVVLALEPWSLLFLTLFGLIESALSLRARQAARLSAHPNAKPEKN